MSAALQTFLIPLGRGPVPTKFWYEDASVVDHKRVHETSTHVSGGSGSGTIFGGWGSVAIEPVTSTTTSTDRDYLFLNFGDREAQWTLSNLEYLPRAGHRVRCFFVLLPDGKTGRALYMWNFDLKSGAWLTSNFDFLDFSTVERFLAGFARAGMQGAIGVGLLIGAVAGIAFKSVPVFVAVSLCAPVLYLFRVRAFVRKAEHLRSDLQDEFLRHLA